MKKLLALLLALLLLLTSCELPFGSTPDGGTGNPSTDGGTGDPSTDGGTAAITDNSGIGTSNSPVGTICLLSDIPAYSGEAYVSVNCGEPNFTAEDLTNASYEKYGELDAFGRCTVCIASIGTDIMPPEEEERGSISSVKPTAWHSVEYDIVSGKNLYNRCHLIGHQLTGENANRQNLITGTRYLNIGGMLLFENMIASYVKETEQHVLYRVTPVFNGNNLLASGVLLEAKSVEDNGEGLSFAVFCYNVQPGIAINYADGTSALSGEPLPEEPKYETGSTLYVLNINPASMKVHLPECSYAAKIADYNKQETYELLSSLLSRGFTACGSCKPK